MMKTLISTATLALSIVASGAYAAVTPEEAKQLGTTLTGFGAEKAGNADGSIPAYTGGGYASQPPDFDPKTGKYSNPYPNEKPIVTIDAHNMAQYDALLMPSSKKLLETDPTFHMTIYPTHRTETYPQWVLDNTLKNATSAKLVGEFQGDGVEGAYGGIPFPIPKNGNEIMWNYVLHWQPVYVENRGINYLSDSSGHVTLLGDYHNMFVTQYYDKNKTSIADDYYFKVLFIGLAPSSQVGYNLLISQSINYANADQLTFVYTPGQRRVRVAPEFTYDTPVANFGGALTYDESYLFTGRQDRFDFKIVGKKEFYVPYNVTVVRSNLPIDQVLSPGHPNSDVIRWEKHRVWVVDATLKPDKRHILERRTFYFDEDSWIPVASEGFDHSGNLYRVGFIYPNLVWDPKLSYMSQIAFALIDLTKRSYFVNMGAEHSTIVPYESVPDISAFTPQRLEAMGVR